MTSLYNAITTNDARTENGAVTHSTSGEAFVDFFFTAGQLRNDPARFVKNFYRAKGENQDLAVRTLLWARDARKGAGERNSFKVTFQDLMKRDKDLAIRIMNRLPELGRWSDILLALDEDREIQLHALNMIKAALENNDRLCAKWMPRKGKHAAQIRGFLGLNAKEYRQYIVRTSETVEQLMCSNEWEKIEFRKVPSKAFSLYKHAFTKRVPHKFEKFLKVVEAGEEKINANAIYPHDIVKGVFGYNQRSVTTDKAMDLQWKALPDFIGDSKERIIPLIDTSGSMTTARVGTSNVTAAEVAFALGLYIAERNKSVFKDQFITFNSVSKFHKIQGDSVIQKMQDIAGENNWGGSTNIESAYTLILDAAVKHSVPQEEMPTAILILSDMEFNCVSTANQTILNNIKAKYAQAGYKLPKVVFWGLCSRRENSPAKAFDKDTALISGFSPAILESVLRNIDELSPAYLARQTVMQPRYDF